MRTPRRVLWALSLAVAAFSSSFVVPAQPSLEFTGIQRLTNKEMRLQLDLPAVGNYRIDVSTNFPAWDSLITLTGLTTTLVHTDSAAPYLRTRYYRATQLTEPNILTGDHLATTNGDAVIHPLYHASLVLGWNGKIIYNDPDDDAAYESTYLGLPKADLILISHSHTDHFSTTKIEALRGPGTVIIAPQNVYTNLPTAQRAVAISLAYGASTNVHGVTVQAVHAYNGNHAPAGFGNGYVVTIGGKRIYLSGDTGNQPEIRALANIDVAFLCMNLPFTMGAADATNVIRAIRPKIVYPYHYRMSGNIVTNAATFKEWLGQDLGIEVRLRKWY
jgi:L-ascorbate metabolism protein UlaG (beta-lactamase superfamily)